MCNEPKRGSRKNWGTHVAVVGLNRSTIDATTMAFRSFGCAEVYVTRTEDPFLSYDGTNGTVSDQF